MLHACMHCAMTHWQPHVTVAAVIERAQKYLMVEERVEGHVVFNQPAGHWEPDETLIEAAQRETLEETGWEFYPTALVGIYRWQHPYTHATFLRFTFCGTASSAQTSAELSTEIISAAWHSAAEVLALPETRIRSTMVIHSLQDYLAGKRYDLDLLRNIHQHW